MNNRDESFYQDDMYTQNMIPTQDNQQQQTLEVQLQIAEQNQQVRDGRATPLQFLQTLSQREKDDQATRDREEAIIADPSHFKGCDLDYFNPIYYPENAGMEPGYFTQQFWDQPAQTVNQYAQQDMIQSVEHQEILSNSENYMIEVTNKTTGQKFTMDFTAILREFAKQCKSGIEEQEEQSEDSEEWIETQPPSEIAKPEENKKSEKIVMEDTRPRKEPEVIDIEKYVDLTNVSEESVAKVITVEKEEKKPKTPRPESPIRPWVYSRGIKFRSLVRNGKVRPSEWKEFEEKWETAKKNRKQSGGSETLNEMVEKVSKNMRINFAGAKPDWIEIKDMITNIVGDKGIATNITDKLYKGENGLINMLKMGCQYASLKEHGRERVAKRGLTLTQYVHIMLYILMKNGIVDIPEEKISKELIVDFVISYLELMGFSTFEYEEGDTLPQAVDKILTGSKNGMGLNTGTIAKYLVLRNMGCKVFN